MLKLQPTSRQMGAQTAMLSSSRVPLLGKNILFGDKSFFDSELKYLCFVNINFHTLEYIHPLVDTIESHFGRIQTKYASYSVVFSGLYSGNFATKLFCNVYSHGL